MPLVRGFCASMPSTSGSIARSRSMTARDSADLMNLVRHDLGIVEKRGAVSGQEHLPRHLFSRGQCRSAIGRSPRFEPFPWCAGWEDELKALFGAYVGAKQQQNVLDYDDLLLYWAQLMQVDEIARDVSSRFDHILVDEYQDTNRLQASILLALKPDGRGLTILGDDAQSIYSFRAATVRNILDFPEHFASPAHTITLNRNYRSTQPILAAANAVIDLAAERHKKNLRSERASAERPQLVSVRDESDQARYVADRILKHREAAIPLKQQAVLFRASHHSGPLEVELTRRNIPFVKFGGLKFLEAAHIKDVLAFLAGLRICAIRFQAFGSSSFCRVPVPPRRRAFSIIWLRRTRLWKRLRNFGRRLPAQTIGLLFVEVMKLVRSNAAGWPAEFDLVSVGTHRISSAGTKTPRSAKPISCNWRRSIRLIRTGGDS